MKECSIALWGARNERASSARVRARCRRRCGMVSSVIICRWNAEVDASLVLLGELSAASTRARYTLPKCMGATARLTHIAEATESSPMATPVCISEP